MILFAESSRDSIDIGGAEDAAIAGRSEVTGTRAVSLGTSRRFGGWGLGETWRTLWAGIVFVGAVHTALFDNMAWVFFCNWVVGAKRTVSAGAEGSANDITPRTGKRTNRRMCMLAAGSRESISRQ